MSDLVKFPVLQSFSNQLNIEPQDLIDTLKNTVFSQGKDNKGNVKEPPTDAQMKVLLLVANEYKLNPFTKEIYAFPSKSGGGIVPFISVDGWIKLMNSHPQSDGVEFEYSSITTSISDTRRVYGKDTPFTTKSCPEWIESVVSRKDRGNKIVVREYFDECFRATEPWIQHTRRMLRHKALIQGIRVAFGFSGVYDRDEAEQIIENQEGETIEGSSEVIDDPLEKEGLILELKEKIKATGLSADEACAKFGIKILADLDISRANRAITWCDKKITKNKIEAEENGAHTADGVEQRDDIQSAGAQNNAGI